MLVHCGLLRRPSQWQLAVGSVRLLEVQRDLTNAVLWTSETFANQGFDPLGSYERSFGYARNPVLGYYSRDGDPLECIVKHNPSRPKDLLLTVRFDKPIPPGACCNGNHKPIEPIVISLKDLKVGQSGRIAYITPRTTRRLSRLVRGELDWVVMKALEKDRNRRYETANALAADVQRYLADEPVLAVPPSAGYRLRKFVRRNRPQVLAASLVLLALVVGIAGTADNKLPLALGIALGVVHFLRR